MSPLLRVAAAAVALAAATAASWFAWMGWDDEYQVDPRTGVMSGPYEAWQVVGCVVTLLALAVVAGLAVTWWLPPAVMPVAFTIAWSVTAAMDDSSGLWLVGAVLVLVGMSLASLVVAGIAFAVRSLRSRPAAPA